MLESDWDMVYGPKFIVYLVLKVSMFILLWTAAAAAVPGTQVRPGQGPSRVLVETLGLIFLKD